MNGAPPDLSQFRVEPRANGIVHLVFDCPGRTMNVFSNQAIHELGQFAAWLHAGPVRGVVVRSGKPSGFCAGADLIELGAAYDMIRDAAPADRFDIAFDHFFPLSHAIRRLETSGTPVAAVIDGVALGGGCELAMGAHYRIMTGSDDSVVGLPESAVGLLPGGGGTQRTPRLVGVELALDILLLGRQLGPAEALETGWADRVVAVGEDIAAAETWLLSDEAHATQPWDRRDYTPSPHAAYSAVIERHRTRELVRMLGHEPAPLAILDCVEGGLMQPLDGAIRTEMAVFAHLIQRPEPRNMIRTLFLGKQAFAKADRQGAVAEVVTTAAGQAADIVAQSVTATPSLRAAGFGARPDHSPVQQRVAAGYWFESRPEIADAIARLGAGLAPVASALSADELLQADYAVVRSGAIPAYLGGLSGITDLAARSSVEGDR